MTLATLALPVFDARRLAAAAFDVLAPYGARERVLPPDLATRTSDDGQVRLETRHAQVPGLGDLRALVIEGDGAAALLLLSIPRPDRDVGVFQVELVLDPSSAPCVAIDVHAMSGTVHAADAAVRVLSRARAAVGLPEASGRHGVWGLSRHAIVRSDALEDLERSVHAATTAWALHVYELVLAERLDMAGADQHFGRLEAWRSGARERMHALPVLQERFGVAWTDRFVGRYWLA